MSKCSYAALFPGFFSKIRAAEVTCAGEILSHVCSLLMRLNLQSEAKLLRAQKEEEHLWCELPGVFHGSMYALHRALIGRSHSSGFLCGGPQATSVGLEVPRALFKHLLTFISSGRRGDSTPDSRHERVFHVTDLCPVGGVWRSGGSHSQQFDRSSSVTENIRHFLSHHLLHVLPQVLSVAENGTSVH